MRRGIVTPIAIAIVVAIAPALSGCFGMMGNPIEGVIEGATGGNVDIGGTSLPKGFPESEVPLYDGDIIAGMALGSDDGKIFNVSVKVSDASAFDQITTQLEGAGFTADGGFVSSGTDGGTAMFSSDQWSVLVVVSSDSSDGWTANYTVTSVTTQ
jgi:hypothetical protein